MNIGQTLFAQLMAFLPWTTFSRLVNRSRGDRYVKSRTCAEQFRVMAFAKLTYRESLRDIEVCPSAQSAKLYHRGFPQEIKRFTPHWPTPTRRETGTFTPNSPNALSHKPSSSMPTTAWGKLENTAYALDATTIDLCLSLFPWAPFRSTKAAVKMYTLLDFARIDSSFIHISDGKLHDVKALDLLTPEPGAI